MLSDIRSRKQFEKRFRYVLEAFDDRFVVLELSGP